MEASKIEDVVQDFVSLRKRGVNMIGLCPFHHEKTPSFTVSPSKNIFKCFGCGVAGDSAKFVMEHEKFSYPEALRYLAKKYRIEIEEVELTPEMLAAQQEEESLYIVNDYARQFFQDQLFDTDKGRSIGLDYFRERGFLEDTIRKFGLGYAPDSADTLTQTATKAGYKPAYLRKLGLSTQYDKDFFRNRVMFTIHNLSGKTLAFAGRIMVKDPKAPKYINSPETDIYVKNKVLYGAYFAKTAIRQADECILVEGYTDVISLHQAGIENVVASSGTSLTEGQINLVKRFTPNIKILFDGDPAGIKAALRGIDMLLERNMNVKIVLLPEKEDPDSYLQKVGSTAFTDFIDKEARDFILFKTNLLLEEVKGDPVGKARLVRDIVDSIAKVPDPFKRSFYIKECAAIMQLSEQMLVTETNRQVRLILHKKQTEREQAGPQVNIVPEEELYEPKEQRHAVPAARIHEWQERDIVRVLIAAGSEMIHVEGSEEKQSVAKFVLGNIQDVIGEFDNELYHKVVKESMTLVLKGKDLSPQYFIGHKNQDISTLAVDLLHSPYEYSLGWEARDLYLTSQKMPDQNFQADSKSSLLRFKLQKVIRVCEKNQHKLSKLDPKENADEMMKLLKVQAKLLEIRNELARQLGTVVLK